MPYIPLMENFTPLASSIGGLLIGLSASILWLFNGRVAGISGIFWGGVSPTGDRKQGAWQWSFLGGLLGGGLLMSMLFPSMFSVAASRTIWMVAIAGLFVGFGVRMGGGCTSGHGVCGLSRFSARSLVATLTFITTGAITVLVVRLFSGAS